MRFSLQGDAKPVKLWRSRNRRISLRTRSTRDTGPLLFDSLSKRDLATKHGA